MKAMILTVIGKRRELEMRSDPAPHFSRLISYRAAERS